MFVAADQGTWNNYISLRNIYTKFENLELRNQVTQNDVTLRVTNSNIL